MRIINLILISCLITVFASCEYGLPDKEKTSSDNKTGESGTGGSGSSGSGGGLADGGQSTGGDAATNGDASQAGGGDEGCPSPFRCTAPAGVFMCTDQETGAPPSCSDTECAFGTCTESALGKYCVQECAPETVEKCPESSVCNTLLDGASICAESILWSAPPCQKQEDCRFGTCERSYYGLNLCVQPCEPTKVEECPADAACVPLQGRFFCADTSTGLPPTCSSDSDCDLGFGACVNYLDQRYCTQECQPKLVEACPAGSSCRIISPLGFYCSDNSTLLPPTCQTQEDCEYGTCIKYGEQSYCTEYCSQPGLELMGVVNGTDGPLEGVEVCVFENGAPREDDGCSVTDENGLFAIVGLDSDIPYFILSMTKEGYQSALQLAYALQLTSAQMFTEEEMQDAAEELGLDYPVDDTGQIVFMTMGFESVEGYTVELSPDDGEGPYYADESGVLADPDDLEEASISGWGAFFNVPERTYFLDLTGAGDMICGDLPAVTVVSGYLTYVLSYCYATQY